MKKLLLGVVVAQLLLSACSTSSSGRKQIMLYSNSALSKMGATSFEQMKAEVKISTDLATNQFVQCVADAITVNVPKSAHDGDWEVVVFDSPQINAFALPGGKIGVYTGILNVTENQHQLAAIMGHEVGHVIEHHSNERLSSNQVAQGGLAIAGVALAVNVKDEKNKALWMAGLGLGVQYGILMPYGRTHESEADIVGQDLMAKSGFEPSASIRLWENMAKNSTSSQPEFLSTHPSNQTRIKQLTEHLAESEKLMVGTKAPTCVKPAVIPISEVEEKQQS
jgi:predicted Zn-dependent protease